MKTWPIYGEITGPIVMIGFGSIGRGHAALDRAALRVRQVSGLVIIDPSDADGEARRRSTASAFIKQAVTKDNYRELLIPLPDRRRAARAFMRQPVG